jgi:hypothetical protein
MTKHVYCLIDPRTNKVRYIGCTQDINRRVADHIGGWLGKIETVQSWIDELVSQGLHIQWKILETTNDTWWGRTEQRWLKHYKLRGEADLNGNPGQYQRKPRIITQEFRDKMSRSHTGISRPQSEATKAKISASLTGRKKPEGSGRPPAPWNKI